MKAEQAFIFAGGCTVKPKKLRGPGELVDSLNYIQAPGGGYETRKGYELAASTGGAGSGSYTKSAAVFDVDFAGKVYPNLYSVARITAGSSTKVWVLSGSTAMYELQVPSFAPEDAGMEPSGEKPVVSDTMSGAPVAHADNFYGSADFSEAYISAGSLLYSWKPGAAPVAVAYFGNNQIIYEITRFKDHLAVLAGESIYFSAVGEPADFAASTALQIGLGSAGVCMCEYQGALFVATNRQVLAIQGSTTADFQMRVVLQRRVDAMQVVDGRLVMLTRDSGLITLNADNVYGDFIPGDIGASINDYIKAAFPMDQFDAYPYLFMYFNEMTRQLVIMRRHNEVIDNPDVRPLITGLSICMDNPIAVMPIANSHTIVRFFELPGTVINPDKRYYGTDLYGRIFRMDYGSTYDGTPMFGWLVTVPHHYGSESTLKLFKKIDVDVEMNGEGQSIFLQTYADEGATSVISTQMNPATGPESSIILPSYDGIAGLQNYISQKTLGFDLQKSQSIRINNRGKRLGMIIGFEGLTSGSHKVTGATVSFTPRRKVR